MELYRYIEEQDGIKPCPFCGRSDEVTIMTDEFYQDLLDDSKTDVMHIQCERCRADIYCGDNDSDYKTAVSNAVRVWNTRGGKE